MSDETTYQALEKKIKELELDVARLRQTEKLLKDHEGLYRILSEQVVVGVTLVQDDRFIFVNPSFVAMFGFEDLQQLVGKRADELFPKILKRGAANFFGPFPSAAPGNEFKRMASFLENNAEKWLQVHHTVIKYMGRPALLSVIRDITERRLWEMSIQEEAAFLREENITLRSSLKERYRFGEIIGMSRAMQEIYLMIAKAANSDANVAIYGESGTGKELVARAIHDISGKHRKEFVIVNCGAIPEELLESEFFGHKKGAFTGAYVDKKGYLDLADGGSLFLDEVGELSLNMQVKLLRTIDGGEYIPVGSNKAERSDFRIISATNRDLKKQVKNGLMREDFFYRIHVIPITLPPLREREEDIPLLINHFLKLYSTEGKPTVLPGNIRDTLYNYHWPGNIRELKNVIQRYVTVKRLDFMDVIHAGSQDNGVIPESTNLPEMTKQMERDLIARALTETNWNRSKAAELLGISRKALYRKIKRHGPT